ncbi:muscle M-line assembly protein unc-89-like isoform X2 [Hemitrygon akajei]|uniref:muscle M-line assembly protein unc-89-like isoform X2 n=1 Tax=Hemitrygon akajei TaxID=2704970 RepID=UPI003BF99575
MKTLSCSLFCLWQLLSQRAAAQVVSHSMVAATGSSVQFPGTDKEFEILNWEFSTPTVVLPITEVGGGDPIIFEKYKHRIKVDSSNGSFVLNIVKKADSGQYKITVDLDPKRTRILTLQVIAQVVSHSMVAATGSSVQFPGTDKEFEILKWDVSNPIRTLPITLVGGGDPIIFEKYKNRIEVDSSNGSFVLYIVKKADSGQYKMTVDLDPKRTRILTLQVIAQVVSHSMVAATGSSVRFPGTDKEFEILNWEFSTPTVVLHITEVGGGDPIIFEKYKNRIKVDSSSGSFVLNIVKKADSGQYKITVDLDPKRTRILTLQVIDSLSTPSISSNVSENGTVALSCTVQRGVATSILWTRGGVVLPVDQRQSLSDGNVTLTIWKTQESDSGYYTCSMENQVSRTNSTYQLIIKDHEAHYRARYGLFPAVLLVCTSVLVFNVRLVYG